MRFGLSVWSRPRIGSSFPAFAAETGSAKERRGAVLAEIADALRAEVRIEHNERGGVERRELRLQKGGRQLLVDSHVVHGKRHVAVAVREKQVGRGRAVGNAQAVTEVDAEIGTDASTRFAPSSRQAR